MESTKSTVLLTVEGDLKSAALDADTTIAIAALLPAWAAACSSSPPGELVVLSGDKTTLYDPSDTLTDLGLGYGSVLRLLTGEEAQDVLEVTTATVATILPADYPFTPASDPNAAPPTSASPPSEPPRSTGTSRRRFRASPAVTRPIAEQPTSPASLSSVPPPASSSGPPLAHQPQSVPVLPADPSQPIAADPIAAKPTRAESTAAQGEEALLPPKVASGQRMTHALKAVFSRAPQATQQVGTFGKVLAPPKASERYHQARQATNRTHNLEVMIRQAALPRCMVIGVVSPKGGAGKTTITALLGMLFAEFRRDPVLALDANPDFGNLRDKLGTAYLSSQSGTDELHDWLAATPAATPADLVTRLGAGPHGLRYLATPTGDLERMVLAADFNLYRNLIARLRDYQGIILVDCGTGLLDPPVRAALETADQILLVTDSSAETAGMVVTAAQHLPAQTPTWLVANKMPSRGSMVDLHRVAEAIPQLRGLTVVPEQRLAENVVTPQFSWGTAPGVWQEPLREIGARLANNWRTLR